MIGHPSDFHRLFDLPDSGVRAMSSLRIGGQSRSPFSSFNLADHVGDDPNCVAGNRQTLVGLGGMPGQPVWLNQVHGNRVIEVISPSIHDESLTADGATTRQIGVVLGVLTADCLPILLSSADGKRIASVHAGWRGIVSDVLEVAVSMFNANEGILAWIGPGIGACHFEVGPEFKDWFPSVFFHPGHRPGHDYLDLMGVAEARLRAAGVSQVVQANLCTVCSVDRFFSYRKEGDTGRMVTAIWRQ